MEYGSVHRNARLGIRSTHGMLCYGRTKTSTIQKHGCLYGVTVPKLLTDHSLGPTTFAWCPHTSMWYSLSPVDDVTSSNSSALPTILETKSPGVVFFYCQNKWQKAHLINGNDKVVTNIGIHFSRKKTYLI